MKQLERVDPLFIGMAKSHFPHQPRLSRERLNYDELVLEREVILPRLKRVHAVVEVTVMQLLSLLPADAIVA